VALAFRQAIRLARALRDLRESEWTEELTQAQLAKALSTESRVASATLSSWESLTNPKTPSPSRLSAYARFFATRRSLDGEPHLIPENQLLPDELVRFRELEEELLGLLQADSADRRKTFSFVDGSVTIVCPKAPTSAQGPLAAESNANFTKLQQYADQDALIELWGHIRAENPELTEIKYCLPDEAVADDFSGNVILLGGIGWNRVAQRFQAATVQLPVTQVTDEAVPSGEIFVVKDEDGERRFLSAWDGHELVEDIAFVARLRNPFKISRTLTICNGIHSRGVLGAVRCLTDAKVRDANEAYLADRFPDGTFAMLLRVPVLGSETVSPDLANPDVRLYEWPGTNGAAA
jgi:transcriptional regulator with XRE-family HTH domain